MLYNNHFCRSPNRRRHCRLIQIVSNIAQHLHMANHKHFFVPWTLLYKKWYVILWIWTGSFCAKMSSAICICINSIHQLFPENGRRTAIAPVRCWTPRSCFRLIVFSIHTLGATDKTFSEIHMAVKVGHSDSATRNRKDRRCNAWDEDVENVNAGRRERDRRLCLAGWSIAHTAWERVSKQCWLLQLGRRKAVLNGSSNSAVICELSALRKEGSVRHVVDCGHSWQYILITIIHKCDHFVCKKEHLHKEETELVTTECLFAIM